MYHAAIIARPPMYRGARDGEICRERALFWVITYRRTALVLVLQGLLSPPTFSLGYALVKPAMQPWVDLPPPLDGRNPFPEVVAWLFNKGGIHAFQLVG